MAVQDVYLAPPLRPARRTVPRRPSLRPREWVTLLVLGALSATLAALFYRVTLLFFVDGTAGVVAAVTLSVLVHLGLALRTVVRQRSR